MPARVHDSTSRGSASPGASPHEGPQGADAPFATALRAAIERRGLGLARIAARLEQAGTPLSTATLSYWQSGRSRPGRRTSVECLATLEQVLGVPAGALAGQLGPPAVRGRHRPPLTWKALWTEVPEVAAAFDDVDTSDEDHLTRLSYHDTVLVGPDRTERGMLVRQVMRCERDGVDRFVVMHGIDEPGCPPVELHPVLRCTLGRVCRDEEAGVVTSEMLLPRPLRRGEMVEVAWQTRNPAPFPPAERYERRRRTATRQYVLEVRFHPGALPVSSTSYVVPVDGEPQEHPLTLGEDGSLLLVELDGRPGVIGARWRWPGQPRAERTGGIPGWPPTSNC